MNYKNITIAGSGVLGYQIAFQVAFHGFKVNVYDINNEALNKAKKKFEILSEAYIKDLNATEAQLKQTKNNLNYTTNLREAVKDADFVIESVPERIEIKKNFYTELAKYAPEKTVFATNSSTMIPSQFSEFTGRPKKFLALHFANSIWKHNTAEIMGHARTDKNIFNEVVLFAKAIGMLALPLNKEQPGYILNSMLIPLLHATTELIVNEVAEPKVIDMTWMKATGAPAGPCGLIDIIGIKTTYNVNKILFEQTGNPIRERVADYFKKNFIEQKKLGISSGEGFYKYPNPEYQDKSFLE